MNILITGASRGIGAAAYALLNKAGHKVVGHSTMGNDQLIAGDLTDPKAPRDIWDTALDELGGTIDARELEEAGEQYAQQVSDAVASDPDTAAYVEELERRTDDLGESFDVPSGDSIAAELTRFLREREQGGDDDAARGQ